jgi:5-methylthioadenosine/S-adenosylhomocysteine deaminase
MGKVLYKNCRYLIISAGDEHVIENAGLLVDGSTIKAVGPTDDVEKLVAGQDQVDVLDCSGKLVMPGLIDGHNHLANMVYHLIFGLTKWEVIRGIIPALHHFVWPVYGWHCAESVYDLTLLGMLNALKHGTTTATHAFHFPESGFNAATLSKMRVNLHPQMVTSVQLDDGLDEKGYLREAEDSIKKFHGAHNGLVTVSVHPSWPWNCTTGLLVEGMRLAEEYDVKYVTHLLEGPDERVMADELWAEEGGAVKHLDEIGLLQERSVFFHCAHLNEEEIDLFAERGCSVIHNPSANARKGDCAYLPYMLEAGVKVGLGTDDPTSNLLTEMKVASLLHNIMPREMRGLRPHQVIDLATRGSAAALGLDDKVGTLEVGKKADIITFDLQRNSDLVPLQTELVLFKVGLYSAGAEVVDAMVDGQFLRRGGEFLTLDEEAIISKAHYWFDKFSHDYLKSKEINVPLYSTVHEEFIRN